MSDLGGTKVIAAIRPNDSDDLYPSHEAFYGKGGLRTVDDLAARSAITTNRREAGMLVYVCSTALYFQLESDLSSWSVFTGGGGGGSATVTDLSSILDVQIAAASAGDVLTWDDSANIWTNRAASMTAPLVTYVSHEYNRFGNKNQAYDANLMIFEDIGPLVTIDNTGDLIYT